MITDTVAGIDVPFLGLHYFDERHESLFFGRDEQLRDLLGKLTGARLVTVIGSSGTGKSSLVRAAVFPALRAGFLTDLRPRWRIVTTLPGSSPIANLATALEREFTSTGIEVTLRRGRLGLLDAARQCALGEDENLLVFVDQFEEIFRYQRVAADRAAAADEASAFVQLLLEATAAADSGVYVVVTMRSDYLGACAQFRNLPERINTGLYLIPRMGRDHLEDAITGPAAVMGATFAPPLVQRMLNDVGEDPDQLPVLQHALLRTWVNWQADGRPPEIDFAHYERTGGVRDSINNHAEEIYGKLDEADQRIVEAIFKALTERDPANLDIRRPTRAGLIAAIAKVPFGDLARVALRFRDERVAFLHPSVKLAGTLTPAAALTPETRLDIAHESLIRKWYRLGGEPGGGSAASRGWVHEEAELRDVYRDLAKRARARTSPLTGTDLDAAIAWRARTVAPEWALRYDDDPDAYERVLRHIGHSEGMRDAGHRRTRWARVGLALTVIAVLLTGIVALENSRDASRTHALHQQAIDLLEIAAARELSAKAEALRDQDSRPELSALLGIEAINRAPIPEASEALRWPLELLLKPRWSKEPLFQPASAGEEDTPAADSILRFSANGRYLALLIAGHRTLRVYDVADGREPALPAIQGRPLSISWSGDELRVLVAPGTRQDQPPTQLAVLAIAPGIQESRQILETPSSGFRSAELTRDGTRLIVDAHGQVTSRTLAGGPPQPLTAAVAAVDGAFMLRRAEPQRATGAREGFSLWRDGRPIGQIDGGYPRPAQVDLGTTSNVLAVSGRDGRIRIYNKEPRLNLAGEVVTRGAPTAFALSPNGALVALGSESGEVRIVKWTSGRPHGGWSHQTRIASVAFSPDGKAVASLDDIGALRLVPLDTVEPEAIPDWVTVELDEQRAAAAWEFERRGRFMVGRSGSPGGADVFDTHTGRSLVQGERPDLIALSQDGAFAAAMFGDGRLSVTNLAARTSVDVDAPRPPGRPVTLGVSPKGRYVAIRTDLGLGIVDVAAHGIVPLPPAAVEANGPVFSLDGRWVAVYRPGADLAPATALLLDTTSWAVAGTWEIGTPVVTSSFSADGGSLLLRGTGPRRGDGQQPAFRFIEIASKKERASYLPRGTTLLLARYSPDGTRLAIATREPLHASLRIFDTQSGKEILALLLDSAPSAMAISPRNHYVGTVSNTGGIQIFDLPAGVEVSRATLRDNERASHIRFSEDEQSVEFLSTWTSPSDESAPTPREFGIRRVHLTSGLLLQDACLRVGRPLSEDEWKKFLPRYPYRDTCTALLPARNR